MLTCRRPRPYDLYARPRQGSQNVTCPRTERASTKGRHAAAAGFTLIEVLVALALLGLVLAVLTEGMRLGLRARRADALVEARAAEMEAASRALRLLFAHAEPGDLASPEAAFIGTEHAVSFVSRLPEGRTVARTADVALAVNAARRLELRWRPHVRRWIATPPPPEADTLLEGVERLDLAYWQSAEGRWVPDWRGLEPPRIVRLHIVFPAGDRRHWPDLIVAPVRRVVRP